jgi:hypothetical protein
LLAHRALELGVFHALAQYVEQIKVLAQYPPAGADAEIAELARLAGSVPALHDALEFLRQFVGCVTPEPGRLDEAAAQRRRGLLVLAGEIVFTDRPTDLLEHWERLARGMQGLAASARKATRSQQAFDDDRLVVLGDRRQPDDLPVLLRQHMADQIGLVQPVHYQHDGTLLLIVQSTVERVVEPFVGALPVGFRQCLFGFQWIVDDDDVGTPPSQHAADRSGNATALGGRLELRHRLPLR